MKKTTVLMLATVFMIASGSAIGAAMFASHNHLDRGDVVQHSGGLDRCGGHWNHKIGTYHYHRGPYC